jgi:opacity protein-like surface antigen
MKISNFFTGLATLMLGLHVGSSLASPSVSVGHSVGDWEIDGLIEGDVGMTSLAVAWPVNEAGAFSIKYGSSKENPVDVEGTEIGFDLEIEDLTLTYSSGDLFLGYQNLDLTINELEGDIQGLFLGTSGSNDSGFYYSAAAALVDAEFVGAGGFEAEADLSFGLSIGLGYAQALTENLVWSAEYKYQNYWLDWDVEQTGEEDNMILSTFGLSLKYSQ